MTISRSITRGLVDELAPSALSLVWSIEAASAFVSPAHGGTGPILTQHSDFRGTLRRPRAPLRSHEQKHADRAGKITAGYLIDLVDQLRQRNTSFGGKAAQFVPEFVLK
jgi:hypothetical protein